MANPIPAGRRSFRSWALAAGLVTMALAAAVAAWQWPRRRPAASAAETDPRLAYDGPYRNVHPDVEYVGDAACAGCHVDKADTYRRHPMGRSLLPVAPLAGAADRVARTAERLLGPLGPPAVWLTGQAYRRAVHDPFEKYGSGFTVEQRGGRIYHREERRDDKGQTLAAVEQEVVYVVGSGSQGCSYLTYRDGCLFQSPISWFTQKQRWDVSPSFPQSYRFDRQVTMDCLFCHANEAHHVAGSSNRYAEPIFRGTTIGCERCHGPGSLHVALRQRGDVVEGQDTSIVNPARLEPALREAVCQQCHLEGDVRVLRRGRAEFEYRPGLPLEPFYAVFVKSPLLAPDQRAVSHVEQMVVSRCFQESKGEFGCTSCHDPHLSPDPDLRVGYYRERCLKCHAEGDHSCTLPLASRRKQNDDDCTACHMPHASTTDIAHTAVTDHRVLRRPAERQGLPPAAGLVPGEPPIVRFGAESAAGDADAGRDLGLALLDLARQQPQAGPTLADPGLPLLDRAVQAHPDDVAAWEARGWALLFRGRKDEALAAWEKTLALSPGREQTLVALAALCADLGRTDEALDYWRRAQAIAPGATHYRTQEAAVLVARRDWQEAETAARKAEALNPLAVEPRRLLVQCLWNQDRKDAAESEFRALIALHPPEEDELRLWFAHLAR
jgi:predicted CXXCH cytochrome family protein